MQADWPIDSSFVRGLGDLIHILVEVGGNQISICSAGLCRPWPRCTGAQWWSTDPILSCSTYRSLIYEISPASGEGRTRMVDQRSDFLGLYLLSAPADRFVDPLVRRWHRRRHPCAFVCDLQPVGGIRCVQGQGLCGRWRPCRGIRDAGGPGIRRHRRSRGHEGISAEGPRRVLTTARPFESNGRRRRALLRFVPAVQQQFRDEPPGVAGIRPGSCLESLLTRAHSTGFEGHAVASDSAVTEGAVTG